MRTAIACVALLLAACTHHAGPAPETVTEVPRRLDPVAATGDDESACRQLAVLGCPEASPARGQCADSFARARTNADPRVVDAVAECVGKADTAADARGCGRAEAMTITCPGR